MPAEMQATPVVAEPIGFKSSSLASAVNAKPFVPSGGYTEALMRKHHADGPGSEPSSPMIKAVPASDVVKVKTAKLATGDINFKPALPLQQAGDATFTSTTQGTPQLSKSSMNPTVTTAKADAAVAQKPLLHSTSDAPSLDEFLPEAYDDHDTTASLAPAFSDAEQKQRELTAAADVALSHSPRAKGSADESTATSQSQASTVLPSSNLRIKVDQASSAKAGSQTASPSGRITPSSQPVVDTAAIAAAATLSAIMKVTVNPAAMVNMLSMLGSAPATLTTADIIELAETIQKHPPLMSWLTTPSTRPASSAPSSGRATPTALPSFAPAATAMGISTTPESAVLLLAKIGVPVTPETIISAQQLLKQIAAMGMPGSQPMGPLPFGLSQQQLAALANVLRNNAPLASSGPASAPTTPANIMQQAQLAAMLQFSKSLPSSPSAAAAAASAGWAAATANMFPGSVKDSMQAAMTAYFAQQGNPMAAMDPHRIAMMSAAMLANPMLANPAAWHNPALLMQMAAAASKNPVAASLFSMPSLGSYPNSPMAAAAAANPFSTAQTTAAADGTAGNGDQKKTSSGQEPSGRAPSRSQSAATEQPASARTSRTAQFPPGMDAATVQLLSSLSPKAAEALLQQMLRLQTANPTASASVASPKAAASRTATYSHDELPSSLAAVASAVEQDIQRLRSRTTDEHSAPPPPPPRSNISISRATSSANEAGTVRIVAAAPPPPPGLPIPQPARMDSMPVPPPPPPRKTSSANLDSELVRAVPSGIAAGEPVPGSSASRRYTRTFMMSLCQGNTAAPTLDPELSKVLEHKCSASGPARTGSNSPADRLGRWNSQDISSSQRADTGDAVRRQPSGNSPCGRYSNGGTMLARGNSLPVVPPPPPRRTGSITDSDNIGLARGNSTTGAQQDERWDANKPSRTVSASLERKQSMGVPPPPPPMVRTTSASTNDPFANYLLPAPPSPVKTHLTAGVLSEFEREGTYNGLSYADRYGSVSGNLVSTTPLSDRSSKSSTSETISYSRSSLSQVPPPPASPPPRRATSDAAARMASSNYSSGSPPPPPPRRTNSQLTDLSGLLPMSRSHSMADNWSSSVPPPPASPPPRRTLSNEGASAIQRTLSASIPPPPPRRIEGSQDDSSSWQGRRSQAEIAVPPPPPPPRVAFE